MFSGWSKAALLWGLFVTCESETSVCVTLVGSCAYWEVSLFWFTKSFALRNEVSMLCHLVLVLSWEVHISRWMLYAWMPALEAHARRVQERDVDFDGSLFYTETYCPLGSYSILIFVLLFHFHFLIIFPFWALVNNFCWEFH